MKILIALLVLSFPIQTLGPKPLVGIWSQYDRIPTEATIAYRQKLGQLPDDLSGYAGGIAVLNCEHIGKTAWIRVDGTDWLRVFIFDCSGDVATSEWMREGGIIGELGYHLARRLGVKAGAGVKGEMVIG